MANVESFSQTAAEISLQEAAMIIFRQHFPISRDVWVSEDCLTIQYFVDPKYGESLETEAREVIRLHNLPLKAYIKQWYTRRRGAYQTELVIEYIS